MRKFNGFLSILLPLLLLLVSSCRKEEYVFVGTPPGQALLAGSNAADLLRRTVTNDGSVDNIIDGSNCFTVALPVTVVVNGTEIVVENEEGYNAIEVVFDEDEDDVDTLEIIFPITIVLNDFTTNAVLNADELQDYADDCHGENEEDDDIECVNIQYPITVSIFNSNSEAIDTISFLNDMLFYGFLNTLDNNDIVSIDFPISLILHDGTSIEVADLVELESVIENAKDDCDEDDDNDVDDDDCIDCTTNDFIEVWAECSEWEAHLLEIDGETLALQYVTYVFSFQEDGSVLTVSDTDTWSGTWASSNSGDTILLDINIVGLDDFNGVWELQEIKRTILDTDVRLKAGENRVHFRSICLINIPPIDPTDPIDPVIDITEVLTTGVWEISNYLVDSIDQLALLGGHSLTFNTDGEVVGNNLLPLSGIWSLNNESDNLTLDFGLLAPLNLLNAEWEVISVSETQVELEHTTLLGVKSTLILTK